MEPKTIEMAALGRALYPGMLYDCRRDSFIPGVTLWDKQSLSKDLDVHRQPKTDLKFVASDSLRDKASVLDVSASLKASFLGGLVEVGGSARYLRDKKSSDRQSRVTMQYSQTTRFEQLTMTQLGKISYPEVFEQKTATHVVTAVLYGGQAFMVFDKTVSENEDKQEVEGNLRGMVKKIPSFSIEGEGALKMNENEKKLADNISCTFYGDYELEENPTTYMEALQLYKKLPSLLRQRENDAVPVRVWLHPLARLDSKAAKLEREIGATLITKVEGLLEELGDAERRCNDLVQNTAVNDFQDVGERLHIFQESFGIYKVLLQKALASVLPAIRGGEVKDSSLADILTTHANSPFRASKLKQWLENVNGELDLLSSYTRELSEVPIITSSAQFNSILFSPMVDTVICFSFTSVKYEDPYLQTITEFLTADPFEKQSTVPKSSDQDIKPWFSNPEISKKMKENLSLFKSFFNANKDKKTAKFVISSISDPSNPGISIRLYKQEKLVDGHFQPVSKPPAPSVDIQNRNVILKLQKSPTGVTRQYRVEYRVTQPDASGADGGAWETIDTPDAQETFTLTGLQLANQYWVRYRVVSDVGVSEASESVQFSLQGKVTVPVGKSWNWTSSSLFNELRKKIMTNLGVSRWSLSTITSEVLNQLSDIRTPYVGPISGGLRPGIALYFQGVVNPDANDIMINHKLGPKDGDDVAFHFNPRVYNNSMVRDSFRNGKWESIEESQGCPLVRGSAFDIFIVVKTDGYEAYVNGQKKCFFKHRMPIEKVTTLHIKGDVFMNTIGYVANWSTSTFGKEQSPGVSRGKFSQIQLGVPYPVCNPSIPFVGPLIGGLKVGLALFFQGVVPSDANSFAINLKTGQRDGDDIAFHFNPRVGTPSVVRDSFRNGRWENPEETSGGPFVKGGGFDLFMVVKPEGYEVIVNGHVFCMFWHRMPVESVSALHIHGDIFMTTFGLIEVDNVNMKVIMPAHI
ncbi:verrucotoxin subunit beta-like [Colossoma macropomum]|uniref:verrucotoxin subunit beta-like n=1 Tax=Colossoma macropomum TaxID=42526 RepID=UPI0018655000|nr:verrucotoxin subunit beta-like [Colossoma macropomum]